PSRTSAPVAPTERGGAPVGLGPRRELVRARGGRAAAQRDRVPGPRGLDEQPRRLGGRIVDDAEVELAHSSPAASSFDRSIAAWIAFRNAARTPACSSSR